MAQLNEQAHLNEQSYLRETVLPALGAFAIVGGLWLGVNGVVEGIQGDSRNAVPKEVSGLLMGIGGLGAFAFVTGETPGPDGDELALDNRGEL